MAATGIELMSEAALKERLRPKAEAEGMDLSSVQIRLNNSQLLALASATAGAGAIADLPVKFQVHETDFSAP
jgi:hypothetical protein